MGMKDVEVASHRFGTFPTSSEGQLLRGGAEVDNGGCSAPAKRVPRNAMPRYRRRWRGVVVAGGSWRWRRPQQLKPGINKVGGWTPEGVS